MTIGLKPYRNFFDMKGIYLFLIEYFAQLICYGRLGCFIVQVINLFFVLMIIDKIHTLLNNNLGIFPRIFFLIPYLVIMSVTFQGGNLTEEFSLPFVLICLYFCEKYCLTLEKKEHPPVWALIYGICFGVITFIRITNAFMICTIILIILIDLIVHKHYKNIFLNGAFFIGGFIISCLPGLIFCYANGILTEMLKAVFGFGYLYASEGSLFNFSVLTNTTFRQYILLIVFSCIPAFIHRKEIGLLFPILLTNCVTTVLSLGIGNCYLHYFTLLIPHMALSISIIVRFYKNDTLLTRIVYILLAIIIGIYMYKPVREVCETFYRSTKDDRYVDYNAKGLVAHIPSEQTDSVYSYIAGSNSKWYIETDLFPCIKYCDWQNHYIELYPPIKDELETSLIQTPPQWIITSDLNKDYLPEFFLNILNTNYSVEYENKEYLLWKFLDE